MDAAFRLSSSATSQSSRSSSSSVPCNVGSSGSWKSPAFTVLWWRRCKVLFFFGRECRWRTRSFLASVCASPSGALPSSLSLSASGLPPLSSTGSPLPLSFAWLGSVGGWLAKNDAMDAASFSMTDSRGSIFCDRPTLLSRSSSEASGCAGAFSFCVTSTSPRRRLRRDSRLGMIFFHPPEPKRRSASGGLARRSSSLRLVRLPSSSGRSDRSLDCSSSTSRVTRSPVHGGSVTRRLWQRLSVVRAGKPCRCTGGRDAMWLPSMCSFCRLDNCASEEGNSRSWLCPMYSSFRLVQCRMVSGTDVSWLLRMSRARRRCSFLHGGISTRKLFCKSTTFRRTSLPKEGGSLMRQLQRRERWVMRVRVARESGMWATRLCARVTAFRDVKLEISWGSRVMRLWDRSRLVRLVSMPNSAGMMRRQLLLRSISVTLASRFKSGGSAEILLLETLMTRSLD
mmetsp:Transcript_9559/g.23951  ORF Transcript_9559/g.23951 Transcript_9559/m.23951 type:complete len:454 (+) Transcript_9559:1383-2744(+)